MCCFLFYSVPAQQLRAGAWPFALSAARGRDSCASLSARRLRRVEKCQGKHRCRNISRQLASDVSHFPFSMLVEALIGLTTTHDGFAIHFGPSAGHSCADRNWSGWALWIENIETDWQDRTGQTKIILRCFLRSAYSQPPPSLLQASQPPARG